MIRRPERPGMSLEAEASLQFHHTSREAGCCRAELRIGKRRASVVVGTDDGGSAPKGERRQIQLVEDIVGGHAQLDLGAFSEDFHCGESEFLRDGQINILIPWPAKAVAPYPREVRSRSSGLKGEVGIERIRGA